MRAQFFIILLVAMFSGLGSPTVASGELVAATTPVPLQEAFREAKKIERGENFEIAVSRGQTPLVALGATHLLVVPVVIDESKSHILKIRSRVVKKEDGSLTLFYPILSFLDKNFHVYKTVKPKYEYMFADNVLTNEFEIPQGVERLLIRTDEEFTHGSFVGVTSKGGRPGDGAFFAAGLLGGIVGALILYAATSGEPVKEFTLGEEGVMNVAVD